jgi:hypothetical protein
LPESASFVPCGTVFAFPSGGLQCDKDETECFLLTSPTQQ